MAKKFKKRFYKKEGEERTRATRDRIMSQISSQLMPLPTGLAIRYSGVDEHQPFILSSAAADLIKELPQEEKIKVVRAMAREHNENVERENRFIKATMMIINIIFQLLIRR